MQGYNGNKYTIAETEINGTSHTGLTAHINSVQTQRVATAT